MFIFTILICFFSFPLLADSMLIRKLHDRDKEVFDITPKKKLEAIRKSYNKKRSEDESPWLTWERTYSIDKFSFYNVLGSLPTPSRFVQVFGYWSNPPSPPIIPVLEFQPYVVTDLYCPQSIKTDNSNKKFWIYKRTTSKKYRATSNVKMLQQHLLILFAAIREKKKVKVVFDNKHCLKDNSFRILSIKLADYQ